MFQGPHSFWHQLFHSPHCGMHQLFQGPHPCAEAEEDPPALNANERLANAKAAINLLQDIFTFMVVSPEAARSFSRFPRLEAWPES